MYETQIQQPAKYRADFPLRIAALASIQDWDWVTWHYWGDGSLNMASNDQSPFAKRLDVTTAQHPQGYHFTYDEVQTSLMMAAGNIFVRQAWKHAPNPTVFIYGSNSLYSPQSMNYGHSYGYTGKDMLQTVYQYGTRIKIDTTREDDIVIGPVIKFAERNAHNPYTPTSEITMDWKQGYFQAISAQAVAYAGRISNKGELWLGNFKLSNVAIHNPDSIYSPVDTASPYLAIAIYTKDGKTLPSLGALPYPWVLPVLTLVTS
ncbi:MAG: hypothetical protein HC896_18615 [Bacteroidales bacterium]|nr:hypothetical protein [Bacteroidales bacterium]